MNDFETITKLPLLETVEKVSLLLQLQDFGYGFVSPPRRILTIYAIVVLPRLARNPAIS